jgi:hypothetical protein
MKKRSLEDLAAALATCSELGLEEDIVKQAQVLKEELEEQKRAVESLKEAMTDRGLEVVSNALKRCKKVGVPEDEPTYAAGRELEATLIEEKSTEDELIAAAESRDESRIAKALKAATRLKMPETAGVKKALKMQKQLAEEVEAIDSLKKAMKANKAPGLLAAINRCTELGLDDRKELAQVRTCGQLLLHADLALRRYFSCCSRPLSS